MAELGMRERDARSMDAASLSGSARLGTGARNAYDALVVGIGTTGVSCVRHLRRLGVSVAAADSRNDPPGLAELASQCPEVPVFTGGFRAAPFDRAREIVLSPGVSLREPAVARAQARGLPVYGDIELFARAADAPVVAITGSNGKSTVTRMLGDMAGAAGMNVLVGGNLGPPALSLLGDGPPALYVLELSSFQLETTWSLEPAAATVLNVHADHMDRYDTVEAYAAAKAQIFCGRGAMVLNRDDRRVAAMAESGRRCIGFTMSGAGPGDFGLRSEGGTEWLSHGDLLLMPAGELRAPGRHNLANALAALALGTCIELPLDAMLRALRSFNGLPHRCELVVERHGVRWYNDSKGTNVGATLAALRGLGPGSPLILIAGGDGKGADFSPLRPAVQAHARAVVLFGRDAPEIEGAIKGAVPVQRVADLSSAVGAAANLAERGDSVLFSPACASFDMFANYEERGRAFVAEVLEGGVA